MDIYLNHPHLKETLPTSLSIFMLSPNTHDVCVGAEEEEGDPQRCVPAVDQVLTSVTFDPHHLKGCGYYCSSNIQQREVTDHRAGRRRGRNSNSALQAVPPPVPGDIFPTGRYGNDVPTQVPSQGGSAVEMTQ